MKCDEVDTDLNAYVDGELSPDQIKRIGEHLRCCANCSRKHSELARLIHAIRSGDLFDPAPAHLRKQISNALKKAENPASSWSGFIGKPVFAAAMLVLGVVIGWVSTSQLDTRRAGDNFIHSLASAHVRSLMANHLTDVASSDSHTVKPWFHGRLDFSPPVRDLTRQGYPLIGGRLEYLAGGSAAALVYRHRRHTINLFIAPKAARTGGKSASEYNGYNIIGWSDGSLAYWLVSDLNPADLRYFKSLLRGETRPKPEANGRSSKQPIPGS